MTNFIYNDGGRAAAGYEGKAGDCVTRAIAIAAELPYQQVYDALHIEIKTTRGFRNKKNASPRNGVAKKITRKFLKEQGWLWHPTMGIGTGCKVHLRAEELPKGRLIVAVSKHLVAVLDGVIHDTHDPSRDGTRCVYGYYTKDLV